MSPYLYNNKTYSTSDFLSTWESSLADSREDVHPKDWIDCVLQYSYGKETLCKEDEEAVKHAYFNHLPHTDRGIHCAHDLILACNSSQVSDGDMFFTIALQLLVSTGLTESETKAFLKEIIAHLETLPPAADPIIAGLLESCRNNTPFPTIQLFMEVAAMQTALTRISHKISSEGGQDVRSDLLSSTREHCQATKARVLESKDGRADCPDSPRGCEKCGLKHSSPYRATLTKSGEKQSLRLFFENTVLSILLPFNPKSTLEKLMIGQSASDCSNLFLELTGSPIDENKVACDLLIHSIEQHLFHDQLADIELMTEKVLRKLYKKTDIHYFTHAAKILKSSMPYLSPYHLEACGKLMASWIKKIELDSSSTPLFVHAIRSEDLLSSFHPSVTLQQKSQFYEAIYKALAETRHPGGSPQPENPELLKAMIAWMTRGAVHSIDLDAPDRYLEKLKPLSLQLENSICYDTLKSVLFLLKKLPNKTRLTEPNQRRRAKFHFHLLTRLYLVEPDTQTSKGYLSYFSSQTAVFDGYETFVQLLRKVQK